MVKLRNGRKRWDVLSDWVTEFGWTQGAELGVFGGRTHLHLLNCCRSLTMVGVDLWAPQIGKDNLEGGRSYQKHNLRGYEERLRVDAAPYGSRSILIRDDTVRAAEGFHDGFFDFVFIDADHTTEAVLADITAWKPKIRPCGYLSGHDIHFPSVAKAVNEAVPGWQEAADHVWWVQC